MSKFSKPDKKALKPRTLRDARVASKKNRAAYIEGMKAAFERLDKKKSYQKQLESLLGLRPYRGKVLASDAYSRFVFQSHLIKHLDEHQKHNPKQRFFFLTFMSDEFRTTKKEPGVWLKRLRVKTDKALRSLCQDHGAIGSIAMLECAWVTHDVDERTGMYHWHSHAILWADETFDLDAAKQALEARTNWKCTSGVRRR